VGERYSRTIVITVVSVFPPTNQAGLIWFESAGTVTVTVTSVPAVVVVVTVGLTVTVPPTTPKAVNTALPRVIAAALVALVPVAERAVS
jgi:hypothetical protein